MTGQQTVKGFEYHNTAMDPPYQAQTIRRAIASSHVRIYVHALGPVRARAMQLPSVQKCCLLQDLEWRRVARSG